MFLETRGCSLSPFAQLHSVTENRPDCVLFHGYLDFGAGAGLGVCVYVACAFADCLDFSALGHYSYLLVGAHVAEFGSVLMGHQFLALLQYLRYTILM